MDTYTDSWVADQAVTDLTPALDETRSVAFIRQPFEPTTVAAVDVDTGQIIATWQPPKPAMNAENFLARVVAPGNYLAITHPAQHGGMHARFFPRDDISGTVGYAKWAVGKNLDVWYCPASFETATANGTTKQGPKYKGERTQVNAQKLRALWYDADIKRPGDNKDPDIVFADAAEFEQWLRGFCAATGLPPSLVVNSGYGRHVYWILEAALKRDDWQPLAEAFKAMLLAHGAKGDVGLTTDAARLLRPPQTLNFKDPANPRPVEVLEARGDIPNALIKQALAPYMGAAKQRVVNNNYINGSIAGTPPALAQAHRSTLNDAAQAGVSTRRHTPSRRSPSSAHR